MRTILALLFLAALLPAAAQHTFDVKYPHNSLSSALLRDLYRLTPSKILCNGNDGNSTPMLMTIDNNGMIKNQVKFNFKFGSLPFYRYYSDSNIIVMFITDALNRLHHIRLDTNLNLQSDYTIDSNKIGISSQYTFMGRPKYITLADSSIVASLFYSINATSSSTKRIVLHFERNGIIINRYIFDSTLTYSDEPLFQMATGKIVWRTMYYDSLRKTHSCLRTSDAKFNFDSQKYLDGILFNWRSYDYKSIIPTADSGFALLTSRGVWPVVPTNVLTKFDKGFRKQWEAMVPGVGYDAQHIIESKARGFYVITQTISDTTLEYEYPALCYLDIGLSQIDSSGKYIFTAYYGTKVCTQRPYSAIQDSDGGIIISALYNTRSESPWCEFTCDNLDSTWIFKVDSLGHPAQRITSITESGSNIPVMNIYPNPASGTLIVEFGRAGFYSNIELLDIQGNIVHSSLLNDLIATQAILDISYLADGNYFCRLLSQSGSITRLFIIQR